MNINAQPLTAKYIHSSCEYIPSAGDIIIDECQRMYIGDGVHKITELPIISYVPEPEINAQTFLEENIELIDSEQFDELFRKTPPPIFDEVLQTLEESGVYHRTYNNLYTKEA